MTINFDKLNTIFYYRVCNDKVRHNIKYIRENFNKDNYIILADTSHISTYENLCDYYSVVGRCSVSKTSNPHIIKRTPDFTKNFNSAMYHSLLGNNGGFIPVSDIPIEKRLNGTWTYSKFFISKNKERKFNYKTCKNWHVASYDNKIYTYESKPLHLMNYTTAKKEVKDMFPYVSTSNKHIVIAPFDKIDNVFVDACSDIDIRYIIYSGVYDVYNKMVLPIYKINLETIDYNILKN